MRIISGKFKGRKLHPPVKNPARPTTDFAKEGLFNIINNNFDFESVRFLDLFGGTGNISFEFASRGCPDITTIELFGPNVSYVQKMATELNLPIQALRMDVFQFINNTHSQWDIIFAGPPYKMEKLEILPDLIMENKLLSHEGWFILEHNPAHNFEHHSAFAQKRNYGSTIFSIFNIPEL